MTEETKQIERLDWRTFMNAGPDTPPETIKALDDYFSHFAAIEIKEVDGKKEIADQKCCGCGDYLTGFLRGTWRWGIAHGVGECSKCGWPSHGHHFVKDAGGEDVVALRNFILQVHPDFVEQCKRA
jgi:hypothetical protein